MRPLAAEPPRPAAAGQATKAVPPADAPPQRRQQFEQALQRAEQQHAGAPQSDDETLPAEPALPSATAAPLHARWLQADADQAGRHAAGLASDAGGEPPPPAGPALPQAALPNALVQAPPPAPTQHLPASATGLALQRAAIAAGAPTGHWQLLLPVDGGPLRAVELQRQSGGRIGMQLQVSAAAAATPGGAAALDRLRGRLARHAVFSSDDELLP